MESFVQDIRYGIRSLRKTPGFTAVAAIALGLGIGANTVLFSVISYALLRPLPYPDPDRLVILNERGQNFPEMSVSVPNFLDWEAPAAPLFTSFGAARRESFNLTSGGEPEPVEGRMASAGLLPALGVRPLLGRLHGADDDRPGAPRTVVLSHGLWTKRFGADPAVLGKSIELSGESYTVVGVLPPDFRFLRAVDLFVPLKLFLDRYRERGNHPGLYAFGRMKAGVTLSQLQKAFDAISERLGEEYPEQRGNGVTVRSLREDQVGDARPALLVLWGAVAFVLLIAAANVANLLLARATARQGEIGIRVALGAGRGRILRQLLTESVLLSLLGGALAAVLAWWGVGALAPLLRSLPRGADIRVDGLALAFTAGVALLTGTGFGLYPALRASSPALHAMLKEGRSTAGHARLRSALLVAEVALSMVLLIGAGLFLRSFSRITGVNPGFDPDHVLTMAISLPPSRYRTPEALLRFESELRRKAAQVPGVTHAAIAAGMPFLGAAETSFTIAGRPPASAKELPEANIYPVTPEYLDAMRIRVLQGRFFDEADGVSRDSIVIDDAIARKMFPGESPLGQRFMMAHAKTAEIIGVVGHVQNYGLDGGGPVDMAFYVPYAGLARQVPQFAGNVTLVVRTAVPPESVAQALRKAVLEIDPEQPVFAVQTMESALSQSVSDRKLNLLLLGIFASVALLLASVGIYGVMSYSVEQRTREIGIRMALGAGRRSVLGLVVGSGVQLAAVGIALGVAGAAALSRVLASLLYGVSATDPATYGALAALLGSVAAFACWLPARRAVHVDPAIALRAE